MTATAEKQIGTEVSQVSLEIDYEIIEHFSRHLYGSPNKAIEELISNGFDAKATAVHVTLPTGLTPGHFFIWDNGESMDSDGIERMWKLARSPKKSQEDTLIKSENIAPRRMIGKFGIGKLASYTLGNTIAHLCKTAEGRYFLVEVDYTKVMTELTDGDPEATGLVEGIEVNSEVQKAQAATAGTDLVMAPEPQKGIRGHGVYRSPILEVTQTEARAYIDDRVPLSDAQLQSFFLEERHWTLAIISGLKPVEVHKNFLSWVVSTGMPLRPDFKVFIDGVEVTPAVEDGLVESWDFAHPELQRQLTEQWVIAQNDKATVSGTPKFGTEVGLDPAQPTVSIPFVELPYLGKVWGSARLFNKSLASGKAAEHGRSVGFFILVRGRLINPEDSKFLLHEPSFGSFFRSQYIVNADGLNDVLLADRERINRNSPKAAELRVVQHALYLVTDSKQRSLEEAAFEAASGAATLPTYSREYFIDPITALLSQADVGDKSFNMSKPEDTLQALPATEQIAILSPDKSSLLVNENHPYIKAIETKVGRGKRGLEFLTEIKSLALSELIFKGYLVSIGLPEEQVNLIMDFRNRQLLHLAKLSRTSVEQLCLELEEASRMSSDGKKFEIKIVEVLRRMGFIAERDGRAGQKDISVFAPAGEETFRITFEAKSKAKPANEANDCLANDEAEISNAAAHRKAVNADHAVVVAPCFKGFKSGEDPMILKECREQGTDNGDGKVSIMTVEALQHLLRVMDKYKYPFDQVRDVFTTIESPSGKLERIKKLEKPLEDFNFRDLLETIWRDQQDLGDGQSVAYKTIWQRGFKRQGLSEEEFGVKLIALSSIASSHIVVNNTEKTVFLRQAPGIITEYLQDVLGLEA